jgi:putative addiction module component (TIGR02574 family)
MTKADLTRQALELPLDDQLDLAQALWEHASPVADYSLPPELEQLLAARLLEAHENPEAGVPWEEVRARLFERT